MNGTTAIETPYYALSRGLPEARPWIDCPSVGGCWKDSGMRCDLPHVQCPSDAPCVLTQRGRREVTCDVT